MALTRAFDRLTAPVVAALLLALPGALGAQETVNGVPVRPDGEPTATKPPRPLGGGRDQAYASSHNVGYFNTGCFENITAAADFDEAAPCFTFNQVMNNGFTAAWPRELHWSWGTTKTTWDSAVAKVPALANAIGGGWTVINVHQTGTDDLDAADNSLGLHHAGVSSVNDRSGLDQRPVGAGWPLLPGSNCPQTWGSEGWKGGRPVPLELWTQRYGALGNNFNFDFWRVSDAELDAAGVTPPSATSPGKTIGSFQAYGFTSDYTSENLCGTTGRRNYAHIVPTTSAVVPGGCTGADPTRRRPGWPLGIEVRFDAFTFQLPALKEIMYWQLTFTNRSRDLYGVALDYDSVYISLQNGWFGGAIQQNPTSWVPAQGALVTTSIPVQAPCSATRLVSDFTCAAWGTLFGFSRGAAALIMLKSPIGDLRNKWFTRVGSPFYNPAHPLAGDTLTFQHGHLCGFRACGRNTFATDPATTPDHEQRAFGMISSTERNVLGTRDVLSGLTDQVYFHTFRNVYFPTVRYTPGDGPSVGGGFSRWAPNMAGINWDWGGPPGSMNDKDGVQDTMAVDGCWVNGCTGVFGDTLPNGKYAAYSNTHGTLGVGPIRLMADSVVSFVVAITTAQANDSAGFAAAISAAIDNYMNFYLAPDAAPKCDVTGVTREPGPRAQDAVIRISWDDACFPGSWTDPFLNKQYNDLVNAPAGSPLERLRLLNPWLDDTLNFLRNNNIAHIYLYKSCNDGGVWTTGDDCIEGSPATGAPFSVLGWLPYATFDPGSIPATFQDLNVRPGQTYTYNVIGETRGANFQVLNGDSVGVVGGQTVCLKNCRVEPLALAPVLFNALSASTGEPNVGRAYLPLSRQAGASAANAAVTAVTGPVGASRLGITVTNDSVTDATYRVAFGTTASAKQIERFLGTDTASVTTQLKLVRAAGDTLVVNGTNLGGITPSGATVTRTTVAAGVDSVAYTWASGPVMAFARLSGAAPTDALLVSNTLTGASATPAVFHGSSDYPQFDLSMNSTLHTLNGTGFNTQAFFNPDSAAVPPLVEPTVTWLTARAAQDQVTAQSTAYGDYYVSWGAYAFGTGGTGGRDQFVLDFSTPSNSATAINTSLAARAIVSTGAVTPEVAAAVQAATTTTTPESLVAVKLPFSIVNRSYGRPVTVAMRVRPAAGKSIVVGAGADTIRVPVPADAWVPGDTLIFLEAVNGGPLAVTFERAVIGCDATRFTRESCNPVYPGTRGSTVYLSPVSGQYSVVSYHVPLTPASAFTVTATKPARGENLTSDAAAIRAGLAAIRVVPNPYVMLSQYAGNVLLFTHMPPRGYLRIYTVAGQFVQQISWTEANVGADGDLSWNLRTREGNLLGGGLYIYVLTATDATGATIGTRTDKFVVIR